MSHPVKKILVVGGGTAGWMTAAYLAKWLEGVDIQVSLVESDQIGTIGVGEATVPGIHQYIRDLEISENEFIRATNATFKLGIEFENWAGDGKRFFHPFAGYGVAIEDRPFYKTWWAARGQGFPRDSTNFVCARNWQWQESLPCQVLIPKVAWPGTTMPTILTHPYSPNFCAAMRNSAALPA